MDLDRTLLDRKTFAARVFARDRGACVFCGVPGVDAHHVMERKLFTATHELGGYYVDNGITVCAPHHLACETTDITVEEGLAAAGIPARVTPASLDPARRYDKWGDEILADGTRLPGPLFGDDGARKALRRHLGLFLAWGRPVSG